MTRVLGIETSCDETAVAIVGEDKTILSNQILSQIKKHQPYGGVVPEIAARAHMEALDILIQRAFDEAGLEGLSAIDAIAVTAGPGLIGGVIVGVMTAKALASVSGTPLIAVNHLEGHALTARLTDNVPFPYLLLLISGGHCQLLTVQGLGKYTLLGSTLDDALGEAYDKVAKMLHMGYPGGPAVEKAALTGDGKRFAFPRSLKGRTGCDFSFSGLKTAVKREVDAIPSPCEQDKADICASFQQCVADILHDRLSHAFEMYQESIHGDAGANRLVIAGGVAANRYLYTTITECAEQHAFRCIVPPVGLCTDNAVMIAWAGLEYFQAGITHDLTITPRARWALYHSDS